MYIYIHTHTHTLTRAHARRHTRAHAHRRTHAHTRVREDSALSADTCQRFKTGVGDNHHQSTPKISSKNRPLVRGVSPPENTMAAALWLLTPYRPGILKPTSQILHVSVLLLHPHLCHVRLLRLPPPLPKSCPPNEARGMRLAHLCVLGGHTGMRGVDDGRLASLP